MVKESLVSVIVPAYNSESVVYRTIESILKQTYKNIEIIIINDGSMDRTLDICKEIEKQYPYVVRVYTQINGGVSSARNQGIKEARGEYIYFADAGDYAEENMLEKYVYTIQRQKIDLVLSGYFFDIPIIRENKIQEIISIRNSFSGKYYSNRTEIKKDFTDLWDASMLYNVWNKLFKTKIIREKEICFPEGKGFNEDRDFVRSYLRHTNSMVVLEECFYHYYRDDDSATGKYRENLFEIRKEEYFILEKFFEEFGVNDKHSREFLARQHIERVLGCVENLFHNDEITRKRIRMQIKSILYDELTQKVLKIVQPTSKKMKVLLLPYKMKNVSVIYISTYLLFCIKQKYPEVFHKMKQNR